MPQIDLCQIYMYESVLLTAVGLATCACVSKFNSMLVHTPTDTHRIVALCGLVESLDVAVWCVGA